MSLTRQACPEEKANASDSDEGYVSSDEEPIHHEDEALHQNNEAASSDSSDSSDEEDDDTDDYLSKVKKNWRAIRDLPAGELTEEICIAAIRESWQAVKYIPEDKLSDRICLEVVRQKGEALGKLPLKSRNKVICLAAVLQNGLALQDVPAAERTAELCLAAISQNWQALQYVPAEHQQQVYDFLSQVKHLIVVNPDELVDAEIQVSWQVYASKEKRNQKTLLVYPDKLDVLMQDLHALGNHQVFELVLLGNGSQRAMSDIGGIEAKDVIAWLEKYPELTKIKLLSCWSAHKTQEAHCPEEQRALKEVLEESKENRDPHFQEAPKDCTLVYISGNLAELNIHQQSKLLKRSNPVFVFYEVADLKYLAILDQDKNNKIHTRIKEINEQQFRFYLSSEKPPKIPSNNFYVDLKGNEQKRKQLLSDLLGLGGYVSKKEPSYKKYKETHPSEQSWKMEWREEYQAYFKKNSLIRNLLEGIQAKALLARAISIKAYYGVMHVDLQQGGFHSAPANVYTNQEDFSFFGENIKRKELKAIREKFQNSFKAVTVTVSKKAG